MNLSPGEIVSASAGSGKTYRLTSRYIALLAEGVAPGRILAITFTRKAAGEILQRILERLAEGALDEAKARELASATERPITTERCAEMLSGVIGALSQARVMTIDALLSRLCISAGLNLRQPPGWRTMGETEQKQLVADSLDRALENASPEDLSTLLMQLRGDDSSADPRDGVVREIEPAVNAARGAGMSREPWLTEFGNARPRDPSELARELAGLPLPLTKKGTPIHHWLNARDKILAALRDHDLRDLYGETLVSAALAAGGKYSIHEIDSDWRRTLQAIGRASAALEFKRLAMVNGALRDLAERFEEARSTLRRERGVLMFEDLGSELFSLPDVNLLDLLLRLDSVIDHAMLDEFQDTSLTQFGLLRPMLDELVSGREDRSVQIVGDPKQSLYGWRHAAPALLEATRSIWPHLADESLLRNWRSSPVVIEAVNTVFGALTTSQVMRMIPEAEEASDAWSRRFDTHIAAKASLPGLARLVVCPKGENNKQVCNEAAAERAAQIVRDAPGASVGILVRTGKRIPELIYLLRAIGVEASQEGGAPLTVSEPVSVLVSLLTVAHSATDTMSARHVAQSPLGPIVGLRDAKNTSQVREVSATQRRRFADLGPGAYLRAITVALSGSLTSGELERMRSAVELAERFEAEGGSTPGELATALDGTKIEAPVRAGVRVMTIHKSKGLEFDAVILPELDFSFKGRAPKIVTDRPEPLGEITTITKYASDKLCAWHDRLREATMRFTSRVVEENLCVLYVAMTRARLSLDLIVPQPPAEPKSPSPALLLRETLAPDWKQGTEGEVWRIGTDSWANDLKTAPITIEAATVAGQVRAPSRPPSSRAAIISPSRHAHRVVNAGSILAPAQDDHGRVIGDALHDAMRLIRWSDDPLPDRADLLAALERHTEGARLAEASALLDAALANAEIMHALSRAAYTPDPQPLATNERAFSVRLDEAGEASLLVGRFDRLVRSRDADGRPRAHVLDYKTDASASSDDEAIARHAPQLVMYARAASIIARAPLDRVRVTLVMLRSGRVIDTLASELDQHA